MIHARKPKHPLAVSPSTAILNRVSLPCAALLCLLAPAAFAQSSWRQQPVSGPATRYITTMAHDLARGRCVLFGGLDGATYYADTWEWDGTVWSQMQPLVAPSARCGHGMAFDLGRQRVVLFGGAAVSNSFSDTWEWDGSNWQQIVTPTSPSDRSQFSMTYDFGRGRTVLFSGPSLPSETWEYDGITWMLALPAVAPPARCCAAFAYDFARQRCLLFGGFSRALLDDTWEWDGTNWLQRLPVHRPPLRCCNAMAYDWNRGRLVMFGGASGVSGGEHNDVWEWDGDDWLERRPAVQPPARRGFALAFDAQRGSTVVFGGGVGSNGTPTLGDTWEYQSGIAAGYAGFGSGCTGSAGTPSLAAAAGQLPWIGASFTMEVASLPPAAANVPFGILGTSNTSWGSRRLPLPLDPFGMRGCNLLASADLWFPLANAGGRASWSIAIPSVTSLRGVALYLQGGVLDPGANALGITLSNAGTATLAIR